MPRQRYHNWIYSRIIGTESRQVAVDSLNTVVATLAAGCLAFTTVGIVTANQQQPTSSPPAQAASPQLASAQQESEQPTADQTQHPNANTLAWARKRSASLHKLSERLDFDPDQMLDFIRDTVAESFYDPNFDRVAWNTLVEQRRQAIVGARDLQEFSVRLNSLLRTLKTSHTAFFSRLDARHYQILGVFDGLLDNHEKRLNDYVGIGADVDPTDQPGLVKAVFDGLPADIAGLQAGDRILTVGGASYRNLSSFADACGQSTTLRIQRGQEELQISVVPNILDGNTMFLQAMQHSVKIIDHQGYSYGYIHAWSYAGMQYHELLRSEALFGELSPCDALILDLRDGWGGASPSYLNLFRPALMELSSTSRDGKTFNVSGSWNKPVALIVNAGTTSGKELFAYGFQKLQRGPIVGQRSAGAVVAGRCIRLSSGDVLYLAVADVHVDGKRLEGLGVAPDVPMDPTATDYHAPVETAIQTLSRALPTAVESK